MARRAAARSSAAILRLSSGCGPTPSATKRRAQKGWSPMKGQIAVGLAIDAKDEKAARWYERFGAMPLLDSSPLSLILPFKTIIDALDAAQSE
ncbi:hypothetical protein Nwi_2840 [Nitrobacter winogradskyi Nb-255]|uniref:Uncharacterized protein n=1 Tax=Nitrobacter winogradskyi (strain ATCC 25391 / DSM 10237 / CIP 104748 / NCIMB 11846 / Nb-255) TaxID=323098 RepID=Q3SNP9_NITWN|nr:hypothetical protein Nwi_2840 [Nitrobacter winogradskyi Nb-255]